MNKQEALQEIERLKKYVEDCDKAENEFMWRAEVGDDYWFVSNFREVECRRDLDLYLDKYLFATGNYFKTEKDAKEYLDYQFAIDRIRKYVKESGLWFRPIWGKSSVYEIRYDYTVKMWYVSTTNNYLIFHVLPYLKSLTDANKLIGDCEKDLDIIRKYKEKNI